jgi:radical SAM protein with 4Fe4S-binding SPASM domain
MDGIAQLRSAGVRLRLKTMVMTLNREELAAMWEMAEKMGLSFRHDCSIISALPNEDNGGFANNGDNGKNPLKGTLRFRLSPEQAAEADFSRIKVSEVLRKTAGLKTSSDESSRNLFSCGAGRSSCHITPYGRMQPCIISCLPSVALTGSLKFQEAWNTVSRQFTAQEAQDDFLCTRCQDKTLCTGCPSAFLLETGNAQEPASFYCKYAARRKKSALTQLTQDIKKSEE